MHHPPENRSTVSLALLVDTFPRDFCILREGVLVSTTRQKCTPEYQPSGCPRWSPPSRTLHPRAFLRHTLRSITRPWLNLDAEAKEQGTSRHDRGPCHPHRATGAGRIRDRARHSCRNLIVAVEVKLKFHPPAEPPKGNSNATSSARSTTCSGGCTTARPPS